MTEWVLVPVEPTQAMIDATNSVPEGAGYLSCVRAYRAMLDAAPAWQAEPVAWVRNLTDPQPHCVTGLQYRTAADADAGVQYIPVYLHPPAAEAQLQGGLDNEELLEAWRTKVPGVEPTDSDLRAFALGVEFGTRGKRVYFDERNSARDAWRRRVKQCETLEAEVQRLKQERDGLKNRLESRHDGGPDGISARDETIKMQDAEVRRLQEALEPFTAIDLTTNQAVDAMDVLRARRALEGGE